MALTISPLAIRQQTTKINYERSLTQLSHNLQKYIRLTRTWTLEKLCKKRDHGMVDLQPVLTETVKHDSSRYQVWNIDKFYTRRNMCIKTEKKQHMWDKGEEKHTLSHIYIYIYILKKYNVCNKSGHKTMVHVMRNTSKPHYVPQKHSPPI